MEMGNEIIKQASGAITEAYEDLVQPSAKPIGTVISLLPRTARLALMKWEKWIINGEVCLEKTAEALREKVEHIPEDRLCEPDAYVAVPALQRISYSFDSDELRDMYANLLAASMDSASKSGVHPSFVEAIGQLTPDEAKFLKKLPRSPKDSLPVVDLRLKTEGAEGYRTIIRNYTTLGEGICENPDKIGEYLDNLSRLNLIEILDGVHLINDTLYEAIENSAFIQQAKKENSAPGAKYEIEKKVFAVTNYGAAFCSCCIDD